MSVSSTPIAWLIAFLGILCGVILKTFSFLVNKQSLKQIGIGLCLIAIVIFSGTFAIIAFASEVFRESNADFDPNLSAIIMAVLHMLGIYLSSMLIDSWGRKYLFGVSCFLCGSALLVFGIFSYLNERDYDMSSFYWLPVASVSFFVFINGAGMRSLPFVYIAEILPENVSRTIFLLSLL